MRIRRIALRNFGGVESSEVTFPVDGVTIVEGENEAGKSSLLRALDAIIEYKDNSSNRRIKDLVPVGKDVGPEVEIAIEIGAYAFTYRKRWVRQRETTLEITRPVREQLTGHEAHDRVTQILADTLDIELWKALRLDQGTALEQATFSGSALGRALDAASGGDVAGDHEDALWDRIEDEYARYWTKTGKSRDQYARAIEDLDEARAGAEEVREHIRSLDEMSADVGKLTTQSETLASATVDAENAVRDLERRSEKVTEARSLLEAAIAEQQRAAAALSAATSERTRRDEQVRQLEAASLDLNTIEQEVADAEPESDVLVEDAEQAAERVEDARAAREDAQRNHERARHDADLRRWEIEVSQLDDRVQRIKDARRDRDDAEAVIEGIAVDEELLAAIEAAYLKAVELRVAVDRVLPEVRIVALRDLTLSIDGTEVDLSADETRDLSTHGSTELVVPDTVKVVVTAGTEGVDVVEEFQEAEAAFASLCEAGGVSGFEDARTQTDRKADAERTRTSSNETIKRDLADLTSEGLIHKFESLTSRIGTYISERGEEPALPADHSVAQDAEARAHQILDDARTRFDTAEAAASAAKDRLAVLEKMAAGREGKLEIAGNAVDSARSLLDRARVERPDEAINAAEADAKEAVVTAERSVTDGEARLRDLDAETLDALLENARALTKRRRTDLGEVAERKKALEITLTVETERGPARLADEAETRLVEAERTHESLNRRAEAAAVLYEAFSRHRSIAHRRYIQPFRDEIERLGRIVYGKSFEVALAEDLSIDTRTLGGNTLAFNQLSTGAQEQLGVLSRIACARLVSDDGGVPVVLDDALGWTDPERLDLMGAAISSAADDCQVIILTCMPDRYAAVGKARTVQI